jgi:hypothetical protein
MTFPHLKFRLSKDLIKKLCIVQLIFRKNNVPDDVFCYMITPLFEKSNINDIYVWYGKFMSVYEYDCDFKVNVRKGWGDFSDGIVNTLQKFKQNTFLKGGFSGAYEQTNISHYISYTYTVDAPHLYVLFRITNKSTKGFVCYTDFGNEPYKHVNDEYINSIIKRKASEIYNSYNYHSSHTKRHDPITKRFETLKDLM